MNTIRDMFRLRHREKMVGTLDINWKEKGFNAGVFVLYPGEWRDLKERAFVLVDKFGKEVFSKSKCQQLLNIIFSGSIYDLPGKYNVSPVYDKHIDDPGIIHYLCAEKPWHKTYPQGHRYPDFRANISAFEYPPILLTDLSRKK
jgi:lipopolysaccharide biosynthesis glycosyltransferase